MVGENKNFDLVVIKNIDAPFEGQGNNYSCFEILKMRYGVYIFQKIDDGGVLYIGEAHSQDIKTRVCQNYTESNTGGTFRRNWCSNGNTFSDFKILLSNCELKCILVNRESKELIRALEAILIATVKPEFNK